MARLRRSRLYARDIDSKPADLHRPRSETMTAFLEQMDARYGGVVPWLTDHGFSAARPARAARQTPGRRLSGKGGTTRSSTLRSAAVPAMTVTSQGTLAASSRCRAARSSEVSRTGDGAAGVS